LEFNRFVFSGELFATRADRLSFKMASVGRQHTSPDLVWGGLYNYTDAPEISASLDEDPTKVWTPDEVLSE
jgi:hypothetical protein